MYELIAEHGAMALALIVSGLSILITRYLLVLIESKRIRDLVGRLWEETKAAVFEVGQTYVDALKEANRDGKLTAIEKREAKQRAIAIAKSNLGTKGLKALARIFDVDDWVANKVEAIVGESKSVNPPAT